MDSQDTPTERMEGGMNDSPYARFQGNDLILRDELAVDRTLLANERTLLAYLRSAIGLLIAGVTIMHFASAGWFWSIGVACLPCGLVTGIIGVARYRMMDKSISLVRRQSESRRTADIPGSLNA